MTNIYSKDRRISSAVFACSPCSVRHSLTATANFHIPLHRFRSLDLHPVELGYAVSSISDFLIRMEL